MDNHTQVIDYLATGRARSIDGVKRWVTNSTVYALYYGGQITNAEKKMLLAIDDVKGGKAVYKQSTSSRRGGSAKGLSVSGLPNIDTPHANTPRFNEATNKGRGIVKGITTGKINTQVQVAPLPRVRVR
jgi:hypothetical protein